MSILILAEHNNKQLSAATLKTVNAALKLKKPINLLIVGYDCKSVAEQANKISNVTKVLYADNLCYQHKIAENISALILSLADDYQYIIASASTTGKDIMPRVAALLDVNQISDVIEIESEDTFYRPIYAGNAIAKIKSLDNKKILTIRTSAFDVVSTDGTSEIIKLDSVFECENTRYVSEQLTQSTRPELANANIVISGGRGLQNGENFSLLEAIADKLNGAVGASRAAVDAGFVSNDLQVGQTGKIIAPSLYIAVGISGAIQHLAGMKDSKVIVAINKDPDAPIFQVADYGLVADLFDVLPELTSKL